MEANSAETSSTETNPGSKGVLNRIVVAVVLLILLIGPLFGPVPAFLKERVGEQPGVIWLLALFIVLFTIIIAVALWLDKGLGNLGQSLRNLGLGAPTRWLAVVVGALVGIGWGFLMMSSILQFEPETDLAQISGFRILAALLAATGALLEDVVTRGFLMNRLRDIKVPGWAQLLLSALVFAFYHSIFAFDPFGFVFSVIYGLILSGLFLWGKRSLTPVILAHSLAVLIAEPFATLLIFLKPG